MRLKIISGNNPEGRKSRVCFMCGNEINGAHVAVTTRDDEYCAHPSCAVSGLLFIGFAVGNIISFFRRDKKNTSQQ